MRKVIKMVKKMKSIKVVFCITILLCLLSLPSYALNLFYSDYDNDEWEIEEITFAPVDTIPDGWYPLRAVSQYLPISVDWDSVNKQVVVYSDDLLWDSVAMRTRKYHINKLPTEMIIKDGVTYCSPRFLASFLSKTGFFYNGEVYCFAGEYFESELIDERDSKIFKPKLLTTLYAMKLFMPDEYELIRTHLTGGIELVYKNEVPKSLPKGTAAYIHSARKHPTCYIVGDQWSNCFMAEFVAHESYHVYQYRTYNITGEEAPTKYGRKVNDKFK